MRNKKLYILIIISIFILLVFGGNFISKKTEDKTTSQAEVLGSLNQIEEQNNIINTPKQTSLVFLGDMMFDRGVETSAKNNFNGNYNRFFDNLEGLKDADILFANLEGPVSETGNNVGSIYSFRMNPDVLIAIKNAGFDIVSFANNHVGDWNVNAFQDTLARLEDNGILKTGAGVNKTDAENPTIIEKNNVKFGFLGFSDVGPAWMKATNYNAGILLANDPQYSEIIQNAKAKVDVLIVSIHFGDEYKKIHNSRQEYLAHTAIDSGADLIIGHHPHVVEDTEEYKGKPIVYSLGNFIFDQYFSKDTMQGMLYKVIFEDKKIVNTESRILFLNKKYQPEDDPSQDIPEKNDVPPKKVVVYTCPVPAKEYDDMWLLNLGQNISLPDDTYIPKDLVEVKHSLSIQDNICLTKEANTKLEEMLSAAKKDGLYIEVSSAFRNYEKQQSLIDNAIKIGNPDANISIAKAGYSEHQLGTTVDLTGSSINYYSASKSFDKTPEANWIETNAKYFGFIRSYPFGKESITGYMYEPWHYRYVGIDNAKEIAKNNLTISEFLK